jgi:hypothetical protein
MIEMTEGTSFSILDTATNTNTNTNDNKPIVGSKRS